jgi:hypothetical protein
MWRLLVVAVVLAAAGCGPSPHELRERTLSVLNTEADRWDGGKEFTTTATDAYGRGLTHTIEKATVHYVLTVRSAGPDGLPKNSDDIVVTRRKRHGESSYTDEASKVAEKITGGAVKGIKKELGLGGHQK